ncbi:hypothetical protein B0H11DRAFT_2059728, partial [Mycena galericulata]
DECQHQIKISKNIKESRDDEEALIAMEDERQQISKNIKESREDEVKAAAFFAIRALSVSPMSSAKDANIIPQVIRTFHVVGANPRRPIITDWQCVDKSAPVISSSQSLLSSFSFYYCCAMVCMVPAYNAVRMATRSSWSLRAHSDVRQSPGRGSIPAKDGVRFRGLTHGMKI